MLYQLLFYTIKILKALLLTKKQNKESLVQTHLVILLAWNETLQLYKENLKYVVSVALDNIVCLTVYFTLGYWENSSFYLGIVQLCHKHMTESHERWTSTVHLDIYWHIGTHSSEFNIVRPALQIIWKPSKLLIHRMYILHERSKFMAICWKSVQKILKSGWQKSWKTTCSVRSPHMYTQIPWMLTFVLRVWHVLYVLNSLMLCV